MNYFSLRRWMLLLICFFPLLAYASQSPSNNFAVGGYYTEDFKMFPLLVASPDQGANWFYSTDISPLKLPPLYANAGRIDSVSCNDNFCVAAGSYQDRAQFAAPLVAISQDHGFSWSYVEVRPSDFGGSANFGAAQTVCNDTFCIIDMMYKNSKGQIVPLVAISQNGFSWSYPSSILAGLPKAGRISLGTDKDKGLHCSGNICIALGEVIQDEPRTNTPLLAVSLDKGETWDYRQLQLPPEYSNASFSDIMCRKDTCLAVGLTLLEQRLFVLRSTDKNHQSWSMIPLNYRTEQTSNITYTEETWIIPGTDKITGKYRPFAFISQDDGKTWSLSPTLKTNLPKEINSLFLFAVTIQCVKNHCIIPMDLGKRPSSFHLPVAISDDSGKSWHYVDAGNIDELSPSNIVCNEKNCMMIADDDTQPYIFFSNNYGKTWSSATLNLPDDFDQGWLYGIRSVSDAPTSLQNSSPGPG